MAVNSDTTSVSVVVPTLNEAENIVRLLAEVDAAFASEPYAVELLVADGGSKDGTRQIAAEAHTQAPVRVVACSGTRGLAGDVLEAAEAARGTVIVVMDADLSHPPTAAPLLARAVLDGAADMAVGSRYVKGGGTRGWPWSRELMSRAAALLAWPLVDINDPTSGFFAIGREDLLSVDPEARGFKIGLEAMLGGRRELRVTEVPIIFVDRTLGQSKMSMKQATSFLGRMATMSTGAVVPLSARQLLLVAVVFAAADWGVFEAASLAGARLGAAQCRSLAVAMVLAFGLFASMHGLGKTRGRALINSLVRLVILSLLVLFLREAVLAVCVDKLRWPALAGLVCGSLVSYPVLALGAWIYVPPRVTGRPAASRWRLAAFGVVGYSFLLRLACLPLLGLSAFVLAGTGTDVPAVSEFARLLPALLESLATTVFVYCLARDLYGKSVGMIAAMLSAVIPLYFMAGLAPDSTALLIACWAGALYFCAQALLFNRRFGWYGGAACVGLGVLLNPATLLLAAALLFYVLVFRDGRHCLRRPDPYLALGILALALVAGVWLATGDPWHALRAAPLKDSYASFFDYFWAFWFFAFAFYLTPVGFVSLSVDASKVLGKKTGAAGGEPNLARNRRFLFTFVFVPVVLSLVPRPVALLPSTLVPVWLAALPLLAKALWDAVALDEQSQGGLVAGVQWLWRPTVVLCLLGFGCLASIGCFAVLVSAE